jgi:hypothetical protein
MVTVTDMFKIGDIVKAIPQPDPKTVLVGIVVARTNLGHWTVLWFDNDTTYYEDTKTMRHHEITPEQWTPCLVEKYIELFEEPQYE